MSSIELKQKIVACRKSHQCEWCGEYIFAKERAHYRVYVHHGELSAEYSHNECWDAMCRSDLGCDDEFSPHEQERGKTYNESHEL